MQRYNKYIVSRNKDIKYYLKTLFNQVYELVSKVYHGLESMPSNPPSADGEKGGEESRKGYRGLVRQGNTEVYLRQN